MRSVCLAWLVLASLAAGARAGTLIGRLDLPRPPARPAVATRGFLDRVENPLAPVRPVEVTREMVIVLEGDEKPASPPQVNWDMVGNSFAPEVVAAPTGAEVVIKDVTKTARTLVAQEDPKLVPAGPINPGGTKSFRVATAGKLYTVRDPDAPYVVGRLIVVDTPFVAYPDDAGRFQFTGVPPGVYKLRIWYRDHWLKRTADTVKVSAKGKTTFNPKIAASAFAAAKK